MTRLVPAELLKLWTTRTARILLALAAAGTAALTVLGTLGRPGLDRWLPDGAALALTAPGDGTLPMWAGGLVFAAYGLALALLGGRLVARRDLS